MDIVAIKIKSVLISIILIMGYFNSYAQVNDPDLKKFINSVIVNFQYPEQLRKSCIPTIALLKIELNDEGKISNIDVSDAASLTFKLDFQIASSKFDKKALEDFAKTYSFKNISILIPYFIHLSTANCPNPLPTGDLNKYDTFNKEKLSGNRFYTDPIISIERDEHDVR